MKCFGCGVEKDLGVLEVYQYDDGLTKDPIPPLCVIECSPSEETTSWRMVVVCHECFHKLSPDGWISEEGWEALKPVVPFKELPADAEDGRFDPASYDNSLGGL